MFWILGSVLMDSGKCFWIPRSVLMDSGKCFWILGFGTCFGFWEVLWILGRVLDSGKCFLSTNYRKFMVVRWFPLSVA